MTTELIKVTEKVNTVSNIKTMATMCTKDLKKRLVKEERDLKSLINKRMNDTIINNGWTLIPTTAFQFMHSIPCTSTYVSWAS